MAGGDFCVVGARTWSFKKLLVLFPTKAEALVSSFCLRAVVSRAWIEQIVFNQEVVDPECLAG